MTTTPWRTPDAEPADPVETANDLLILADLGRWLTLKVLSSVGPATGRALSRWTRLDEKDTMLQLRALREAGFVERDVSDKADRHAEWRVRPGVINVSAMVVSKDQREREAAALWGEVTAETRRTMASTWYLEMDRWPPEVRDRSLNWDMILPNMTVDELKEMTDELMEFWAKWRAVSDSRREGAQPAEANLSLVLGLDVFPLREGNK